MVYENKTWSVIVDFIRNTIAFILWNFCVIQIIVFIIDGMWTQALIMGACYAFFAVTNEMEGKKNYIIMPAIGIGFILICCLFSTCSH